MDTPNKSNKESSNKVLEHILLGSGVGIAGGAVAGTATSSFLDIKVNGPDSEPPSIQHPQDEHVHEEPPIVVEHHVHHHNHGAHTPVGGHTTPVGGHTTPVGQPPVGGHTPAGGHIPTGGHSGGQVVTPPVSTRYEVNEINQDARVVEYNGEEVTVVSGRVNGHDAYFVDQNQDGKADFMIIDKNDNGQIDNGEEVSIHEAGLQEIQMPRVTPTNNEEGFSNIQQVGVNHDGAVVYSATYTDPRGYQYNAVLVDVDNNGVHDVAIIDANNDGQLSDGEVFPLNETGQQYITQISNESTDPIDDELENAEIVVNGYQHIEDSGVDLLNVTINGHQGALADGNHDGVIDELWYDSNDDSQIQDNELHDMRHSRHQIDLNGTEVYTAMHNGGELTNPHPTLTVAANTGSTVPQYNNHADVDIDANNPSSNGEIINTEDDLLVAENSERADINETSDNTDIDDATLLADNNDTTPEGDIVGDMPEGDISSDTPEDSVSGNEVYDDIDIA